MRVILVILFISAMLLSGFTKDKELDRLNALITKYKKTQTDSAIFYTKQAVLYAERSDLTKETVSFKNELGRFFAMKGNFDSALFYFSQNLETGRKINNDEIISHGSINIANIYITEGKYNSAIKYYLEALTILEKGNDKKTLYINYLCLGISYYYLKQYDKSLYYYERCLSLCDQLKNIKDKAYCYNTMGIIKKERGDNEKALDYFLLTDKIASEAKDSSILSHNLGNLGELYGILGNYSQAVKSLESGIIMTRGFKDNKGLAENLILLGNVFVKFGKLTDALACYNEALTIGEKTGMDEIKKDSYRGLSEAYRGLKNFEKADKSQAEYIRIKDSLFNVTSSLQIADMQTKYETEKKENENILLSKENNIKSLEIGRQKIQRNLLIVGFILAFILAGFIFNSARLKHRNKLLVEKELRTQAVFQAQENEKVHLSKELHDGIGPLLSLIKMNVSALKTEPQNEKMISEIKELTSESIREVRTISHALMPSLLQKQGLKAALGDFVEQVNKSANIQTGFTFNVSSKLLPETEIHIYRIIQEAVNNTLKHSEATIAEISLDEKDRAIELSIIDNGKGMQAGKVAEQNGNGLNNIYSRVDFLKGTIEINSAQGKGTEIIIRTALTNA